jgi:ABC-type transport system involved in multi-copper enzyme maturation permease subunit
MSVTPIGDPAAQTRFTPASDLRASLLIARRAALESLRDRSTVITSAIFALALPFIWVFAVIRPVANGSDDTLAALLIVYLLTVGLLPLTVASGIAAGQFAGEQEKGNLAPLLAAPVSNRAIFAGKVLGAVLPAMLYSAIAIVSYLVEIALLISPAKLTLLPPALALSMIALVPAVAIFAATVAAVISSRVRTYQAAQSIAGLLLVPIFLPFYFLAFLLQAWGPLAVLGGVVGVLALDAVMVLIGAASWRREEVLARQ